ncbi:hypothetical protein E4K66_30745 [Bradyrhizobium frederickii]|uniref:DUF6950 domain-containing protein n=1 Tax=Bradyrhizobium frederickii TaxID=2560054 RepID=A0A4Y9KVT4_9BRAD|nr:hypothetical protein [Bradyrhizobium frederickii]TFV34547.1 hypothetical protein E4K66_30745 [Bradyrhizobium frederickii]
MAEISAALKQYLSSMSDRRWAPGAMDCGVFMADWVRMVCGRDPIADVRGTYDTERQFLRILRREGGFERSCAARLAAAGYVATETPAAGDLAIVLAPYAVRRAKLQRRPTGAICINERLRAVMTSDLGVVIAGNAALPLLGAFTHG